MRFILVLDAFKQLDDHDIAHMLGWWPGHLFTGPLRLIVSSLPNKSGADDLLEAIQKRRWPELCVQPLTVEDRWRMIADQLTRIGKILDEHRLVRLVSVSLRKLMSRVTGKTIHPAVARALNNLTTLFYATNRLAEAESLMRQNVEILLKFTPATGHMHPHLKTAFGNYASLLREMGRSPEQIRSTLKEMGGRFGIGLLLAGGHAQTGPHPDFGR
jgi:hypothetical protein